MRNPFTKLANVMKSAVNFVKDKFTKTPEATQSSSRSETIRQNKKDGKFLSSNEINTLHSENIRKNKKKARNRKRNKMARRTRKIQLATGNYRSKG